MDKCIKTIIISIFIDYVETTLSKYGVNDTDNIPVFRIMPNI